MDEFPRGEDDDRLLEEVCDVQPFFRSFPFLTVFLVFQITLILTHNNNNNSNNNDNSNNSGCLYLRI